MERGPLLEDWWVEAAGTVVPFLNIEARFDGAPDQGLLSKKGGRGFPYCAFMDSEGRVLWEGRPSGAEAFKTAHDNAKKVAMHVDLVLSGKATKEQAVALMELFPKGMQQRDGQGLPMWMIDALAKRDDMKEEMQRMKEEAEKAAAFKKVYDAAANAGSREEAGANVFKLYTDGIRPPKADSTALNFWYLSTLGAIDAKKAEEANKCLAELEKVAAANDMTARVKRAVDGLKKSIGEIK